MINKLQFFSIIMMVLFLATGAFAGQGATANGPSLWISSVHADTVPAFSVNPASVDFGTLFISSTMTETLTVTNTGTKALFITSVTVDSGDFSVSPSSATIDPFGSWDFYVTFTPTTEGLQTGNVVFVHNASTSPDLVGLMGDGTLTGVEESNPLPRKFALKGNYPNPFNPTTSIVFDIPKQTTVSLTIYNALGAEVAEVLKNEAYQPGTHEVTFNGVNVASGIYFYRLRTPEFSSVKKMVLLK
jgi:hypothetical protein